MHPSLVKSAKTATPLYAVTAKGVKSWLAARGKREAAFLKAAGFEGQRGDLRLVPKADGGLALAVLGLGEGHDIFAAAQFAENLPPGTYEIAEVPGNPADAVLGFLLGRYAFTRYKKKKTGDVRLVLPKGIDGAEFSRIAESVFLGRDLINTPPNDMGPAELAAAARVLAKTHKAEFSVISGAALLKKNYPLIHAVGKGSARAPCLIDLRWGDRRAPKVTLVGKGVCFDTGGYNLKPTSGMLTMKKDMGGAATVLAIAGMAMGAKLNFGCAC